MASLKVLISSTCFDLGIVRSKLREFIKRFSFEPVMSDMADVVYDPAIHTHTACVREVENCDLVVLLIGGRFGGTAVPDAMAEVDIERVSTDSRATGADFSRCSITQLEVLRAIELKIPVFTLIDRNVLNDHLVYERNKSRNIEIEYPSIEKQTTAKYIFEFVNFVRLRLQNNAYSAFANVDEIEEYLGKQWSGLWQRMLSERRSGLVQESVLQRIHAQLADLRAVAVQAITQDDLKSAVEGVLRFWRMIDVLVATGGADVTPALLIEDLTWDGLLSRLRVEQIEVVGADSIAIRRIDGRQQVATVGGLSPLPAEWAAFNGLSSQLRSAIVDASLRHAGAVALRDAPPAVPGDDSAIGGAEPGAERELTR